ncbi:MAG TPA: glutathione S-transferase family protein [Candidatus Binatia bacterium]|jgi:glutathione S-transferase|nr:glutathione S-transferase family protein [Candidatus Binatia bacterium]
MTELIVHHYPESFFAEKIRRILAYKNLPWRSVTQPILAPKPDLTPLTGGLRRVPVMQIGADVYVDTACIARRIERLHPEPACFPPAQADLAGIVEDWADRRFVPQVVPSVVIALLPELPPGMLEDRARMSPALSEENLRRAAPYTLTQALQSLDRLDAQLRGRRYLLGDAFTIADAACFHPVWFLRRSPRLAELVAARPNLSAWVGRIEGFGPGRVEPMAPAEALAIARTFDPTDINGPERTTVPGLTPGDAVAIMADDYGTEACQGTVLRLTAQEIAVRRHDPTLGEIAVHFPRIGYRIARQ